MSPFVYIMHYFGALTASVWRSCQLKIFGMYYEYYISSLYHRSGSFREKQNVFRHRFFSESVFSRFFVYATNENIVICVWEFVGRHIFCCAVYCTVHCASQSTEVSQHEYAILCRPLNRTQQIWTFSLEICVEKRTFVLNNDTYVWLCM